MFTASSPSGLPLILASASPRRGVLLSQARIVPACIIASEVDETPRKSELPRAYALRMAVSKAKAVAARETQALVLAADTVVALGRRILPKAEEPVEVGRCLRLLSGRRHTVITALALNVPEKKIRTRIVMTRVAFRVLSEHDIADYVECGEGQGKAGGYAIQGSAEAFVRFINGSYSNVVGLPLCETVGMLTGANSEIRMV